MKIILNEDSVHQGKNGAITGEIYFSANDRFFPEENWSDFVATILGWWINSYANAKSNGQPLELCFMDGPYSILGNLIDNNVYKLVFIRHDNTVSNPLFTANVSEEDLRKMLLSACRKFFKIAAKENMDQKAFEGLRKLFFRLKEMEPANRKRHPSFIFGEVP